MGLAGSGEFQGTRRFELRRRLGEGAFGVVFEAWDRERGLGVALKLLRATQAAQLQGFKREFRALSDIVHPNLVTLYELFTEGPWWFYTMELVDGVDFLSFVRGDTRRRLATPTAYEATLPSGEETRRLLSTSPREPTSLGGLTAPSAESAGMLVHAAVAKRRRGELLGGDEGAVLVASADSFLAQEEVTRPGGLARMLSWP